MTGSTTGETATGVVLPLGTLCVPNPQVEIEAIAPSAECAFGGLSMRTSFDLPGTTPQESRTCFGGFLSSMATLPAGPECSDGGVQIQQGLDLDGDGALAATEVSEVQFLCNGTGSSPSSGFEYGGRIAQTAFQSTVVVPMTDEPAELDLAAGRRLTLPAVDPAYPIAVSLTDTVLIAAAGRCSVEVLFDGASCEDPGPLRIDVTTADSFFSQVTALSGVCHPGGFDADGGRLTLAVAASADVVCSLGEGVGTFFAQSYIPSGSP